MLSISKQLQTDQKNISSKDHNSKLEDQSTGFLTIPFLTIDNINSRLLNHWEKEGVINDTRINGRGWRKYSPVEIMWLKVVERLRDFNYPLENIKDVKNKLLPQLESLANDFLANKVDKRLIITSNNSVGVINPGESKIPITSKNDYLNLNLTDILQEVFPNAVDKVEFELNWKLTDREMKLLNMLRSGVFKTFEIETKDGVIKRINAEELIRDGKKFRELVSEYKYQSIHTTINDGKEVSKKRSIKIKF